MRLYRKAKMVALIPAKMLQGFTSIKPRSSRSVIFPHQGLGDLIWALGITKYHKSKYEEVVLIANEIWHRELTNLLDRYTWGKEIRIFPVKVNFKTGDHTVLPTMRELFSDSDFYPLGWFGDSYPVFYPDWFYLDARTPRSFMTSLNTSEIRGEFDTICRKYDLPLKQFSYSYVHLQSGTQDVDPATFERKFLNGVDALTICPHHVFSSPSTKDTKIATHFHEVAKSLLLWENLVLSYYASDTAIVDSALFNLMAATKLWPRNLTVLKRSDYHHFWGRILRGQFKEVPSRSLRK